MKRLRSFTIVVLSVLWLVAAVSTLAENPKNIHPTGYVTDLAGVIASETKARLEALCREVEEKTGAQIAVVTVHSLEGESVENFAVNLYKQLGVGSKGDNRGVTLSGRPPATRQRREARRSSPIGFWAILFTIWIIFSIARAGRGRRGGGGGWWIGPMLGGMGGGWRGGGFGGSSGGYSGGGGFGGFGGGSSGGGGASGSW